MEDKLLNYLKIQIALKKLTKEQVISKYPQYEGKI
jgi:hypothetical protein